MNTPLEAAVTRLLDSSLGQACTAAVCQVSGPGLHVRYAGGNTDPEAGGRPVTDDIVFDLASLTKLFVGTAALRLIADGDLDLNAAVHDYLPSFRGEWKCDVLVWHLLTHTSGLPPGPALYGRGAPVDPWAALLAVPLAEPPGRRVCYSDTGFMVLGRAVETVFGAPLDVAVNQLVCAPLGLRSLGYGPRPEAVATEWDSASVQRVRGRVHDENAAAVGGVAGHAGLFGTAGDIVRLARAFADRDVSFLPPNVACAAVSEQAVDGAERRGLAWKLRSPLADAPEHAFSPETFGHYGFTGTAVWHDPRRSTTVVLLTNRVYFGRAPDPIRRLRKNLFDLVARAVPAPGEENQPPARDHDSRGSQAGEKRGK